MRIRLTLFLLSICLASPALGAGAKPEPGTGVEMPYLIAPMSSDGKLLGYAYISSRLICSSPSATVAVREKLAFIQDANVRDVNARPVSRADDPMKVDDEALSIRLADNARRIVGAGKVVRMVFTQVQFAPLHPPESTAGMLASPEKAGAGANGAAPGQEPSASAPAKPQAPGAAATLKPPANPAH
jgi:hypothetical protein